MSFDNPDGVNPNLQFHNVDDGRRMFSSMSNGGFDSVPFDESSFPNNYDFWQGKWSSIIKVNGATNRVSAHSEPTQG